MFILNTNSGYLHNEDHETEGEEFARADEADLAAKAAGKTMRFCKQCFGTNRNTLEIERLEDKEARLLAGKLEKGESMSGTQRVTLEAPPTSVHASDSAVPAGRTDLPTPPQPRPSPQTDR